MRLPINPRGGHYVMNNASFGRMMLSEQMRKPLSAVSRLIQARASRHTQASAGGSSELAQSYVVERGPVVVITSHGLPGPRITERVVNRKRYAARNEFGAGGHTKGKGTRDLRRAGQAYGDLAGEAR